MSRVLRFDAGADFVGHAYVEVAFTARTPVYLEVDLRFDQAYFDSSDVLVAFMLPASAFDNESLSLLNGDWHPGNGWEDIAGPAAVNTWHTVKFGYDPVAGVFSIDGVAATGDPYVGDDAPINRVWIGVITSSNGNVYARNIKIGTTLGGDDLFSWDADTVSLDDFDDVTGAVTMLGVVTESLVVPGWPASTIKAVERYVSAVADGGAVPDLASVLGEDNDAGGLAILNVAAIELPSGEITNVAANLAHGATVNQLIDALIAAGLMASS